MKVFAQFIDIDSFISIRKNTILQFGDSWKTKTDFLVCPTCGFTTMDVTLKLCPVCALEGEKLTKVN